MHDLYPSDLAALDRVALEQAVQMRAQTVYLGQGVALARALTRYKLLLHTSDRGFAGHVMLDGYWEIWLNQFFARTIKPGMTVFDVGANYGYYTVLFADIVTAAGRVIAVEPNPAAAELLRQTVRLNGYDSHVQVVEKALGSPDQQSVSLVVPPAEPKNAHVSANPAGGAVVHQVAVTTIDCLASGLGRVDLLKIDAEGSEENIIAGMRGALREHEPAMVIEFNVERCRDPAGLLDQLIAVYGGVACVGYDGTAVPLEREAVLSTRLGEDWMLYFTETPARAT